MKMRFVNKVLALVVLFSMLVAYFPMKEAEAATVPGSCEMYQVLKVTKETAPLRKEAVAESATVATVTKNTVLYGSPVVNSKGKLWFKVLNGEGFSFIYSKNVKKCGSVTVDNFAEDKRYFVEAKKEAVLRYGFCAEAKKACTTYKEELMLCVGSVKNEKGNKFLKLSYGGKDVFVFADNVKKHKCSHVKFEFEGVKYKYCDACGDVQTDVSKATSEEVATKSLRAANQIRMVRENGRLEQQNYKVNNTKGFVLTMSWTAYTVYTIIAYGTIAIAALTSAGLYIGQLADAFGSAIVFLICNAEQIKDSVEDVVNALVYVIVVTGIQNKQNQRYRRVKLLGRDCTSSLQYVDSYEMSLLEAAFYLELEGDVYAMTDVGALVLAYMVGCDTSAVDVICEVSGKSNGYFRHFHAVQGYKQGKKWPERVYTTVGHHIFYGKSNVGAYPRESIRLLPYKGTFY